MRRNKSNLLFFTIAPPFGAVPPKVLWVEGVIIQPYLNISRVFKLRYRLQYDLQNLREKKHVTETIGDQAALLVPPLIIHYNI